MKYLKTVGVFFLCVLFFSMVDAFLVEIFLYGRTNLGMFIVFVPTIIITYLMYKQFNNQQS